MAGNPQLSGDCSLREAGAVQALHPKGFPFAFSHSGKVDQSNSNQKRKQQEEKEVRHRKEKSRESRISAAEGSLPMNQGEKSQKAALISTADGMGQNRSTPIG